MRAIPIRLLALIAALAILAVAPLAPAAAQDFPSRPVRFIVPYAAGGSGDLLARLLGNKLASIWGQQVVVDNRAGGGGLIGTEAAARSEPDGYTLYLATDGPLTIAASLYKRVPYDWKRDFAPVSMLAMGYQVLIVRASLPARDLKELIASRGRSRASSIMPRSGSAARRISAPSCSSRWRRSTSPTSPIAAPRRRRSPRSSPATSPCSWSEPRLRSRTSRAGRCVVLRSPRASA
jgi:Tripartite tricarboxylate transporter family receptor